MWLSLWQVKKVWGQGSGVAILMAAMPLLLACFWFLYL